MLEWGVFFIFFKNGYDLRRKWNGIISKLGLNSRKCGENARICHKSYIIFVTLAAAWSDSSGRARRAAAPEVSLGLNYLNFVLSTIFPPAAKKA